MSQNIYDNPSFYASYASLPRSLEGLSVGAAPEWPALRRYLPSLQHKSFLDLGCGMGWYSRFAHSQGASEVLGIDLSEKMLARANELTFDPSISFSKGDLENIKLEKEKWDVVFSALALHYVVNLPTLVKEIFAGLRPGGSFVFSVEHPIFTAPRKQQFREVDGRKVWELNAYLEEGERVTEWLGQKGVVKQHRMVGTYVELLVEAGFEIRGLCDWGPSKEQIENKECDC